MKKTRTKYSASGPMLSECLDVSSNITHGLNKWLFTVARPNMGANGTHNIKLLLVRRNAVLLGEVS